MHWVASIALDAPRPCSWRWSPNRLHEVPQSVALGPLLLWGVVLLGPLAVVPADARLTVYILCALNVAGSAGDLYQAWLAARLPGNAVLRDDGNETTVMVR